MKSNVLKAAFAVGALLTAGRADAVANAMTISGASFEDTLSGSCANRFSGGLSNSCPSDTNFIYGIPKGPGTAGYTVTYTGSNVSTALISTYALFSFSSSGNFLAFNQGSVTGVTSWSRNLAFSAAQAPASSRLTAYVGLPANDQGSFNGLSLAY